MDSMSNVAFRFEETTFAEPITVERETLPRETPLEMPRQAFGKAGGAVAPSPVTTPANIVRRRTILFSATVLLASLAALTPFRLYARDGFTVLESMGLAFFSILVLAISCWFVSGVAGFIVLLRKGSSDALGISVTAPLPAPQAKTALLMPLYNEDASAVFGRLAAIETSLVRLGASSAFEIFALSDTTEETVAADEWAAFNRLRTDSRSKVWYRRRAKNTERKAGNIAEWVQRFGAAYDHMIILDADSLMSGETLLRLVDAMERNPQVGLIQTTPTVINASSLYARTQQFSVRLFGRVASAGLAWWSGAEGTYWGHNAIVRTRAFASCAGLPILPGRKPFGGHLLSHDVVEAALLRRGGWAVHVTPELDGSFEETPPNLSEFLSRDRRWCQGNLQHLQLIGAPGLHWLNRLQLIFGCLAYLASPLWFASLLVGLAVQVQTAINTPDYGMLLAPQHPPVFWPFLLTAGLLLGPKLLGCALVLSRPAERRAFGGAASVLRGMALEGALSALMAPILMARHTRMVVQILSGRDAGWKAQARTGGRLTLLQAFVQHRYEFVVGLAFCGALTFRTDLLLWFSPIVLPLLFVAPLVMITSRTDLGLAARRAGFLLTPEEIANGARAHLVSPARLTLVSVFENAQAPMKAETAEPELAREMA